MQQRMHRTRHPALLAADIVEKVLLTGAACVLLFHGWRRVRLSGLWRQRTCCRPG